jgi:hypothetical protein
LGRICGVFPSDTPTRVIHGSDLAEQLVFVHQGAASGAVLSLVITTAPSYFPALAAICINLQRKTAKTPGVGAAGFRTTRAPPARSATQTVSAQGKTPAAFATGASIPDRD